MIVRLDFNLSPIGMILCSPIGVQSAMEYVKALRKELTFFYDHLCWCQITNQGNNQEPMRKVLKKRKKGKKKREGLTINL